jgi:hypothetical protein
MAEGRNDIIYNRRKGREDVVTIQPTVSSCGPGFYILIVVLLKLLTLPEAAKSWKFAPAMALFYM